MATNDEIFGSLIRKLGMLADLDEQDCAAISRLSLTVRREANNIYLVREGDVVDRCCILLEGFACRHKAVGGGGRQIVSFHMAGDLLDLQHMFLPWADHNVQAITAVTVAWVPRRDLHALCRERPAIAEALWRDSLIDASVFREWVLNVGRRDAKTRIAHLLCEFAARRQKAGLGGVESFALPMTQEQIGDATGLTAVHVNRMLQSLRAVGIISGVSRTVEIQDWNKLQAIADFDPGYLHAAA